MSDEKTLLRDADGEAEKDKQECVVIEDIIQAPTRSEVTLALPISLSQIIKEIELDVHRGWR